MGECCVSPNHFVPSLRSSMSQGNVWIGISLASTGSKILTNLPHLIKVILK
ncbi:hypothetical protein DET54_101775 [Paenibacillus pabuli]|uniref:Uncharacterized protein n=1 Tax=Paenibacillus pabuli TaxID=1472 RepID=A0ABX9BU16_9BACL|nr:hypothetical protein DET54_101775 [Paenibacillus pabuli]